MPTFMGIRLTSTILPETGEFTATGAGLTGPAGRQNPTFPRMMCPAITKTLEVTWTRCADPRHLLFLLQGQTSLFAMGPPSLSKRKCDLFLMGRTVINPLDVLDPWAYVVGLGITLDFVPPAGPNGGAEPDNPGTLPWLQAASRYSVGLFLTRCGWFFTRLSGIQGSRPRDGAATGGFYSRLPE